MAKYSVSIAVTVPVCIQVEVEAESEDEAIRMVEADIEANIWESKYWTDESWVEAKLLWSDAEDLGVLCPRDPMLDPHDV